VKRKPNSVVTVGLFFYSTAKGTKGTEGTNAASKFATYHLLTYHLLTYHLLTYHLLTYHLPLL